MHINLFLTCDTCHTENRFFFFPYPERGTPADEANNGKILHEEVIKCGHCGKPYRYVMTANTKDIDNVSIDVEGGTPDVQLSGPYED